MSGFHIAKTSNKYTIMGKTSYKTRKAELDAKRGDKSYKEIKRELEKRARAKKVRIEEEDIIEEM